MSIQLNFPSELHRNYILKIQELCSSLGLSFVLKGSIAKGTATVFSDIDVLILGEVTENIVDDIISCYGTPAMTNYTENPKGILILVYEDEIAVDLEFRYSIAEDEIEESVIVVRNESNFVVNKVAARREVKSRYLPEREQWYKDFRLGHRALIKYLSNKEEDALDLLNEMKDKFSALGITSLNYSGDFKKDIHLIIREVINRYNVDSGYEAVLERLLKCLLVQVDFTKKK